MIPAKLPELMELLPRFQGAVYSYEGKTHFHPDDLAAVLRWWMEADNNDLARIGFRVYAVKEYDNRGIFVVAAFRCSLDENEIRMLFNPPEAEDG